MQLGIDDFGVIFAMLTPAYIVAWNNVQMQANINLRLSELEHDHMRIHKENSR